MEPVSSEYAQEEEKDFCTNTGRKDMGCYLGYVDLAFFYRMHGGSGDLLSSMPDGLMRDWGPSVTSTTTITKGRTPKSSTSIKLTIMIDMKASFTLRDIATVSPNIDDNQKRGIGTKIRQEWLHKRVRYIKLSSRQYQEYSETVGNELLGTAKTEDSGGYAYRCDDDGKRPEITENIQRHL